MILKTIKELNLSKLLVLAILIRLLIMPFYYHPDIKTTNFKVSFLQNGITDVYSYIADNKSHLPIPEDFNYYPLTYFFLGSYQIVMSPFLGEGFHNWISDASQIAQEKIGVFRYLFILKLPYLFFDLLTAFLLLSCFARNEDKRKAFIFWLFNPFSIILVYIFSNFDIIPVTLTVASLLLAQKRKLLLSAFFLGLGAAFKVYPLLFLPFLFLEGQNIKQKVLILLSSLGTFIITILPYIGSTYFREATLVSGLTTRIVFPDFGIGFGESMMVAIILLVSLFFFRLSKDYSEIKNLWKYYLGLLLIMLSFIHYHIQWLLWMLPFAIILAVYYKRFSSMVFLLLCMAFVIPFLYEDRFMSISLLGAISHYYDLLPTPFTVIQKIYDPYAVQSIFHSALAGGSLVFVWQLFKNQET
jgi:hypothetical protein